MKPFEKNLRVADGRATAVRMRAPRNGSPRRQASEAQRLRILSAMAQIACEQGTESATIALVIGRAGVSRRTFYDFEDRSDCMRAVFEEAVAIAAERATEVYDSHATWVDRVRAGLSALLVLLDEEPELARLCVAYVLARGATLTRRGEPLDQLSRIIDQGRTTAHASTRPSPIAAQIVLGGVLGLIYARLLPRHPRPLLDLLNPLMSMIVLPYLGDAAAHRELFRPLPGGPGGPVKRAGELGSGVRMRSTYRTRRVLQVIAGEPGLSNLAISERAGITDQGQVSKLLARLARLELMVNVGEGQVRGGPNAWRLTLRGRQVESAIRRATEARALSDDSRCLFMGFAQA